MQSILYTDTFKKHFKKIFNVPKVVIDDPVFRLHYRATGFALLVLSIFVSVYQLIGDPIKCIQKDDIPEDLLNTYCWIEGTFSLPKALNKKVGVEVVYPGVDKYEKGDTVVEHAYYQWVCFFLFLQSVMFVIPYILWKGMEGGKLGCLIQEFRKPVILGNEEKQMTPEQVKKEGYKNLANYFRVHTSENVESYAFVFMGCEILNFINVIGQIYFLNKFLGGYFTNYGSDIVRYTNEEQEQRFDPMIRLFPRLTKCTFHRFGSSGDVQKHDALCLLPLNILNEKIFVLMWFWLIILAILGSLTIVYRILLFSNRAFRMKILHYVTSLTPEEDLKPIRPWTYSNWFVLYMLADNIDNVHFRGFIEEFRSPLDRKPEEEEEATKQKLYPDPTVVTYRDEGEPEKRKLMAHESDA